MDEQCAVLRAEIERLLPDVSYENLTCVYILLLKLKV